MWRIKLFFRRLKRLIEWLPIIWEGGDYDYGFAINAFKYQLERTAKYIESNGHLENGKLVALQIKTACELIDNTYKGGYVDQADAEFERQYGKCDIQFHDYDEDNFEVVMWWENAVDEEHNKEINEYYHAHMNAAYAKSDRAKDILWRYIHKNIEKWWD
jgi:hypothetical protein